MVYILMWSQERDLCEENYIKFSLKGDKWDFWMFSNIFYILTSFFTHCQFHFEHLLLWRADIATYNSKLMPVSYSQHFEYHVIPVSQEQDAKGRDTWCMMDQSLILVYRHRELCMKPSAMIMIIWRHMLYVWLFHSRKKVWTLRLLAFVSWNTLYIKRKYAL